ncbi:hypothetical protein CR513_43654, partial [Mucuna pruriens]
MKLNLVGLRVDRISSSTTMAEKVTYMKLKVDLECGKCYKKVKKLLGKEIRDQKYVEKENIVMIMVVCCSPEKIRDKLCYKGGGSIKSIEILELPKPKPAEADKPKAEKPKAEPEKKKDEKPKPDASKKDAEKPKTEPEKKDGGEKPKEKKDAEKPKEAPKKDAEKPAAAAEKPKDKPAPAPLPVQPQPQPQPHMAPPMAAPVGMLYAPTPCYEGMPVGPCYNYGGPVLCYDGYYGRPIYDSYGGGRPYYVNRCDQYLSDENPSGCIIM